MSRKMGFVDYVRNHPQWLRLHNDIALENFVVQHLASVILQSSLLSGELDVIPMAIVAEFVVENFYEEKSRTSPKPMPPDDFYPRRPHNPFGTLIRKLENMFKRTNGALSIVTREIGGQRYRCLVVHNNKG